MKKCTKCNVEKDLSEYNKHSGKKDGVQTHCRECTRAKYRGYYSRNKEIQLPKVRLRKKNLVKRNQQFMQEYLHGRTCQDCSIDDWRVLEFDHLSDKENSVSYLVSNGYAIKTILLEIAKCEVVCANCHRLRTFERQNSYRTAQR